MGWNGRETEREEGKAETERESGRVNEMNSSVTSVAATSVLEVGHAAHRCGASRDIACGPFPEIATSNLVDRVYMENLSLTYLALSGVRCSCSEINIWRNFGKLPVLVK